MKKKLVPYSSTIIDDKNDKSIVGIRRMKVYYATHQNNSYSKQPLIRIAGKYLRSFGFKTGDAIELKLSNGRIEITKVPVT